MNLFNDIESLEEAQVSGMISLDLYINERDRLEKEEHDKEESLYVGNTGRIRTAAICKRVSEGTGKGERNEDRDNIHDVI